MYSNADRRRHFGEKLQKLMPSKKARGGKREGVIDPRTGLPA
jgi:hypothetical protein